MNSPKPLSVRCPCCSEILEVDPKDGRVIRHHKAGSPAPGRGEDPLSAALRATEERRARAASDFDVAADRVKNQQERLDSLFDAAKRMAKRDGGADREKG